MPLFPQLVINFRQLFAIDKLVEIGDREEGVALHRTDVVAGLTDQT